MANFTLNPEQLNVLVVVTKQSLDDLDEYLEQHAASGPAEWLAQLQHRRSVLQQVLAVLMAAGDS